MIHESGRHPIPGAAPVSRLLPVILASALVWGCSTPDRLDAVPLDLYTEAVVPGMPKVRYLVEENPEPFVKDGLESIEREKEYLASTGLSGPLPPAHFLAISGGGDDGAFGAGLLIGWTGAGTRPEFKLVTGVSTGALTAPFAFLGPDYDDQLREVYTTVSPDNIFKKHNILSVLFGDGLSDTTPLWGLVSKYVDEQMLEAIAREYAKGRLLLIATTNLDAQRPVVWNVGEIAKSGHPKALELIRTILIASASIPGAFPPVMIDVEAGGKLYQEMHVDGGTVAQVFVYPPSLDIEKIAEAHGVKRDRILYVLRNARVDPQWASVRRWVVSIAGRAIDTLIQTQGTGDLFEIYLNAERDHIDYNLAFIPPDFDFPHEEPFETEYMNQLFDYAYKLSRNGYPWKKYPPGYVPAE